MPEVAECLNRRYRALDELISELSALPQSNSREETLSDIQNHDPCIKLMCDFWNILKEDPDCDLSQAVKHRMGVPVHSNPSMFHRQDVTCYMAGNRSTGCGPGRGYGSSRGGRGATNDPRRDIKRIREICCGTGSFSSRDCRITCDSERSKKSDNSMPLSKALCSLKEAASFDKKCNIRITELMQTQKELKAQILNLEQREKEGVQLLKEADSMWSKMEEEYKNKIAASIERQKMLMKQLKEAEMSYNKWRRSKKELEDELRSVMKSRQEISDKISQKSNDIKCIELEITDFTKRIATNKRTVDGSKQCLLNKKTASDKKIAKYNEDIKKLKATLAEVQKHKKDKETEGKKYVQEAREDLQKICRVLMQKKLENEDLVAEKEGLLQEIDLLKQTCDQCKDKCETKRNLIEEEIKKIDKNIADYKYQCIQCHQCTDTNDARRLCSDCPKCKEQRECITSGDHCDRDKSYDCVCFGVKEKFLNNVFENMYTVLERQTKSKPGKALADKIVKCLKNSRNGKLNCETREQLHAFVLNTVKKNLNLTIVGGAVKTRCELDPDTYKQLMNCLQLVKAEKPAKEDKGTVAKKESCRRWGGTSECHCPGGAKYCACTRRAPPPPKEPTPCPEGSENDKGPDEVTAVLCPHKESISCGPDCAMIPPAPAVEVVQKKVNKTCSTSGCPFAKNMRAAQCVLGPESLNTIPKAHTQSTPIVPGASSMLDKTLYRSGGVAKNTSKCRRDSTRPRDRIIQEVMGRYTELTPIDKVTTNGQSYEKKSGEIMNQRCICDHMLSASKNGVPLISECSSDVILIEGTDALLEMLRKKNLTHVCKTVCDKSDAEGAVKLFPEKHSDTLHKDGNTGVHLILYPKSRDNYVKWAGSEKKFRNCLSKTKTNFDEDINCLCNDKTDILENDLEFEKDKDSYVQKLLHNVIMMGTDDSIDDRNVEWMSVDSLIKLIPSQVNKRKHSKVSFDFRNTEIPVKDSLQNPKKPHQGPNHVSIKLSSREIRPNIKEPKYTHCDCLNNRHLQGYSKCYVQVEGKSEYCQSSVETLYVTEHQNDSSVEFQNIRLKKDSGSNTQDSSKKMNYKKCNVKNRSPSKNNSKMATNLKQWSQNNTLQPRPKNKISSSFKTRNRSKK